ncbi:hypothetical protein M3P05_11500 [Sansalvadorimonas sp. 2012CJ34-2]|uniref:Uncharacterized protein n=1 Tax=Parendozoicomonas callyspongiae TaxID=2942213 RepID=A0ABT0PGS3_9GAMM|nr:hypothetical protein [Sansalvadorimonas sp. 2012CJ34-2]MCL6270548.1 hypothetical protein [Sansalvadorimonas sp. 2012CJ34-2]
MARFIAPSSLSDANNQRTASIFSETFSFCSRRSEVTCHEELQETWCAYRLDHNRPEPSDKGKKNCPTDLRRVKVRREEDGKILVFISNDLERTAAEIAALYKSR